MPTPAGPDLSSDANAITGPQRQRLTVLFSDLVQSTSLSGAMESEQFRDLQLQLSALWHAAALQHEGQVVAVQGDGALIAFGLQGAREDDGRRAAEAALDMHKAVGKLHCEGVPIAHGPLQLHSGIHAGNLLVAAGNLERGVFDLTGEALNQAAHLSALAGPDDILITLAALGPYAGFFTLREWAPPGEGIAQSAAGSTVYSIQGPSNATRRYQATPQRGLAPFVGRQTLLRDLAQSVAEAGQGSHSPCVVLHAGPGMGKTRLLNQLCRMPMVRDLAILRGDCERYQHAEVLQPFVQMLRNLAADRVDKPAGLPLPPIHDDPVLSAHLEPLRGLLSPRARAPDLPMTTTGVVGNLLALFRALAARQPVLLVIDDWQWADDASRQLLHAMLQAPSGLRTLVASRLRDDGSAWVQNSPHWAIPPFDLSETRQTVQALLPQADPFLQARVHDYAGGVPLFVEELCRTGSVEQLSRLMDQHVPQQTWLATLVVSRLNRLPPELTRLVRAAAVTGNVVPLDQLAAACGAMPTQAQIGLLAEADFLHADPVTRHLRFKHGITRSTVYEAIGLHERQAMHRRIEAHLLAVAPATTHEDALETLAYHCRGARHWANAADYAEQAGDKAMAAFAIDRARAQYQLAMDALDRLPTRSPAQQQRWCELANKLGMTCIFDPLALGNDLGVFERSVRQAEALAQPNLLARTRYWLAYMRYGFGQFTQAAADARLALAGVQATDDKRLTAQIGATLGQILTACGQYDEAMALMDSALDAKRRSKGNSSSMAIGSAYTLACKGSILADLGDFVAAHECFDAAIALLDGSTHPVANSVRNWVGIAWVWQGRWAEAEQVLSESLQIAENTRALLLLVVARATQGYARWRAYGDTAGLRRLADATRWIDARKGQFYTSLYHGWLAEAWASEGDETSARYSCARALSRVQHGESLGQAMACRALAMMAARRGRAGLARRWFQQAQSAAERRGSAREAALNLASQAEMLQLLGQPDAAAALAGEAAARLHSLGMSWYARLAFGPGVKGATAGSDLPRAEPALPAD